MYKRRWGRDLHLRPKESLVRSLRPHHHTFCCPSAKSLQGTLDREIVLTLPVRTVLLAFSSTWVVIEVLLLAVLGATTIDGAVEHTVGERIEVSKTASTVLANPDCQPRLVDLHAVAEGLARVVERVAHPLGPEYDLVAAALVVALLGQRALGATRLGHELDDLGDIGRFGRCLGVVGGNEEGRADDGQKDVSHVSSLCYVCERCCRMSGCNQSFFSLTTITHPTSVMMFVKIHPLQKYTTILVLYSIVSRHSSIAQKRAFVKRKMAIFG